MRSIFVDLGSDVVAGTAINARLEDVRLAACLLVASASVAESEIASSGIAGRAATHWAPAALAAAGPLGKIIKAGLELEAAVNAAQLPSATTRATIGVVEAARAAMPDAKTQETIALVEAAHHAVSRQLKG